MDGYVKVRSAIGPVFVAVGQSGVTAARRDEPGLVFEDWYRSVTGRSVRPAETASQVAPEVERFMAGEGPAPAVDLSDVTAFDREVLTEVMAIPRGEVRTYGAVARAIG